MKKVFFLLFFCWKCFAQQEEWTWSYKKEFSSDESKKLLEHPYIIFSKTETPHFNQLFFSWNAFRPKKGFFKFLVQVRHSVTKKWSNWYKMIEWGNKIQKSHCRMVPNNINYIYVRLEMPSKKMADGFRILIESSNGADLSRLQMINVCISNFYKFENEIINKSHLRLPTVKINKVPKKSQMVLNHENNKKMCSPTSTSMLVSFLAKKEINTLNFAKGVYDNGLNAYGSWPFNTAHAFELCPKYFFRVVRLNSFSDLYSYFTRGLPVIVSVRGKLSGAPQDYNEGHIILVIGWNQKTKEVIVHDPAFSSSKIVEHKYKLSDFLKAWERSNRLAYIAETRLNS